MSPQRRTRVLLADVAMPHLDGKTCLAPRQREVLNLLAEGRSAKEIAASLSISAREPQ